MNPGYDHLAECNSLLKTRHLQPLELDRIQAFYRLTGYDSPLEPLDEVLVVEEGQEIKAAVRLCHEADVIVLRGLMVLESCRRAGIGSMLLGYAQTALGDRDCYCIPYSHLEGFYGRSGFLRIDPASAPVFLRERYELYRSKLKLNVILMQRNGSAPGPHPEID